MSSNCVACGLAAVAALAMRSKTNGASIVAAWPVSRLEKRSTSLSKRLRICSTVDFILTRGLWTQMNADCADTNPNGRPQRGRLHLPAFFATRYNPPRRLQHTGCLLGKPQFRNLTFRFCPSHVIYRM